MDWKITMDGRGPVKSFTERQYLACGFGADFSMSELLDAD